MPTLKMRTISKTIHLSYLSCTKCLIMIKTQRGNQMTTIMNLMMKTHRENQMTNITNLHLIYLNQVFKVKKLLKITKATSNDT